METFCECKLLTDIKYFKSSINQPKLIQKHFLSKSIHTFYFIIILHCCKAWNKTFEPESVAIEKDYFVYKCFV